MARFDVYTNPKPGECRYSPYLLDVQNDFISALACTEPKKPLASLGQHRRAIQDALDAPFGVY